MKTLLLLLSCVALATGSFAQTAGQFEIRKYNSGGGMTSFWITPENSKAFGLNGSGVPAMLAVGGSSTLAGLSDVAISDQANLDLLRYSSISGKYENIPGSTYALASSLSDYLTTADAADVYQAKNGILTQLSSASFIFDGVLSYSAAGGFSTSVSLAASKGGTGQSNFIAGDLLYATSSVTLGKLAGNTSATKKVLTQTGNGVAASAPAWEELASSGITIGTTTSNGTAGHVLYTDGANVQAYATTGTGDVVRGTSPTITGLAASSVTGTAAILGANTFTAGQTISAGDLSLTGTTPALTLGTGVIQSTGADTLSFSVNGATRMTIFGSLGFIMTGTDYHDNYTGSFYSSGGSSRDVFFQAAATGIWEQIKSGTQQAYRVYDSGATKYLQVTHDGTNAEVSANSGAVTIKAGGSTRVTVSASGEIFLNLPAVPGTTGSLYSAGGVVTVSP